MSIEKTIEHYGEDCAGYRCPICHNALEAKYEALAAEVAELRETLGHYADPMNWICCQPSYLHNCSEDKCWMTQYEGDGQGWDVAKAVLDKHKEKAE